MDETTELLLEAKEMLANIKREEAEKELKYYEMVRWVDYCVTKGEQITLEQWKQKTGRQ